MAKRKPYRYPLYLVVRLLASVICLIPRSWALQLARGLGRLGFYLLGRYRRITLENLRMAFGMTKTKEEIRTLARQVFEHLAQTGVEVLQFPRLNAAKIDRIVDFGNSFDIYQQLLEEGRGIIMITAHIGNWELLAGCLALKGYQGAVVGRRIYYAPYNRWIVGLRRSVGVETIYRDESPRRLISLLRENKMIGLLPDQDVDSLKGIFAPFFGQLAYTSVAPVKIALATGSPIVTNFLIRQPGGSYRLIVGDVIRPVVGTDREEAIEKYTTQWLASMEKIIRRYPEQWTWLHKRWKTRPEKIQKKQSRCDNVTAKAG